MIFLYPWEDFEKDIICKNESFYIYGAGKIYEKIIHAVNKNVIAAIDEKCNEKETYYNIPVIAPKNIKKFSDKEKIIILCCLYPDEYYYQRTVDIKNYLNCLNISENIYFYTLDYENIIKTGVIKWKNRKLLIDNLQYLINDVEISKHLENAYNCIDNFSAAYLKKLYEEPAYYMIQDNHIYFPDFNNGLIIHENGRKKTLRTKNDSEYSNTIWIFGDSRVSGMLIENCYTISSILQMKIDKGDLQYRVENCGIPGREIERMVLQIKETPVGKGDMVILATGFYEYDGDILKNVAAWNIFINEAYDFCKGIESSFLYVNLPTLLEMNDLTDEEIEILEIFNTTEFTEYSREKIDKCNEIISYFCLNHGIAYKNFADYFQVRKRYGTCFINLHHYGPNGNQLIADKILEYITINLLLKSVDKDAVGEMVSARKKILEMKKKEMNNDEEINHFIEEIKKKIPWDINIGKTGCIVMNANPFTVGHEYLVKKSIQSVDHLIIMVVEEDVSYFSFKDRLNMVRANLKELKGVSVIPSGKFCISKSTFPEYFKKEEIQNKIIDSRGDLTIFSRKLAPMLNIKVRFVGEEPEDMITKQYNDQMKKILPSFGIEVIEIPRKEDNGVPISASKVRKYVNDNNWEGIKELVTEQTYKYLKNMINRW